MSNTSPVAAVLKGLVAGAVGTVAMDLLWYRRYRAGDGTDSFLEWELSSADSFEEAGAPAEVGKTVVEAVSDVELKPRSAGAVTNVTHALTGLGWGALHGLAMSAVPRPRIAYGAGTGIAAWLGAYAVLAPTDIYKPIWEYEPEKLWQDLSAHLVFGVATAATYVGLDRSTAN